MERNRNDSPRISPAQGERVMERNTIVGTFDDRAEAMHSVEDLQRAGFTRDEIGIVSRDDTPDLPRNTATGETKAGEGAAVGVATGAGIGTLVGLGVVSGAIPLIGPAIAAGTLGTILMNAAGGAAAAGLVGALIGSDIPEDESRYYEGEVGRGSVLVTVRTASRRDEARRILAAHGARTAPMSS